jgi:hypothetical protein
MKFKTFKTVSVASVIAMLCFAASAQKLPSVQTSGVRATDNIKIDGKITEWNDKFQAYNNHIECFYTLANDDNNLYLTVQAIDKAIIRRIINGGITLAVNKTGKKNDKESACITFPLFDSGNRFTPRFTPGGAAGKTMGGVDVIRVTSGSFSGGPPPGPMSLDGGPMKAMLASGAALTPEQADSLMKVNNTSFSAKAKNIGTKGIKDLDSLISVYNEEGIKAAGAFDNKSNFTYELAIPLKYMDVDINNAQKFAYHVTINEVEQKGVNIVRSDQGDPSSKILSINVTSGAQMGQPATDFWGEYTLVKK